MAFYEKQSDGTYKKISNIYAGKSAYALAVENGFKGSEKEWLASLNTTDKYTISVPSTGWSSSVPYTLTIAQAGILASDTLFWDVSLASSDTAAAVESKIAAYNSIDKIEAGANYIKLYCWSSPPAVTINIEVVAVHASEA